MSTKTTSGDATECFSADVVAPADDYMVDVEFLNTITLPNFPSHSLKLRKSTCLSCCSATSLLQMVSATAPD